MRTRSTLRILFFAGWASTATLLLWIHRSARLGPDKLHVARGSFFLPDLWKGAWHSVIRSMERIDDRTFLVHGGYENGGLSSSGEDYTVVHRDGRWIVERVVGRWVA